MSSIFQLYRDLFRRRPVMFVVSLIITTVVYAYVLAKFGIIKTGIFSKPTIAIQLEPTETYNVGVSAFALKRVRLVANSNEAIEKITVTIEAPKFTSEVKLSSQPTADTHLSEFESPHGPKRYEVLCRSTASKQELVIILVGTAAPKETLTDVLSKDTAIVIEAVGSTKDGRLFGASAIGEFSLRDSQEAAGGDK